MKRRVCSLLLALMMCLSCLTPALSVNIKYIYFDGNGGVADTPKLIYTDDDFILTDLPSASRDGYVFTGWYDDAGCTGQEYTSVRLTGDVPEKLYAGWSALTYNIYYDMGVAELSGIEVENSNPSQYSFDSTVELSDPVCAGYEFGGWFTDAAYRNAVTVISGGVAGNLTLYAKFSEKEFRIDYVLVCDGIDLTADDIVNSNPEVRTVNEAVSLTDPECAVEGYTFAGWYTDAGFTEAVTRIDEYTPCSVTLYAKWVRNTYTVTYDSGAVDTENYAYDNPNPETYEFGRGFVLENPVSEDMAYTFSGWYSDEELTQPITEIPSDLLSDITVYAGWTANVYSVTYILTDPVLDIDVSLVTNPNPDTRTAVGEFEIQNPVFRDNYYRFSGWYLDKLRKKPISVIADRYCRDLTLYASWDDSAYNIEYDYGILEEVADTIVNENITGYVPETEFTLLPVEYPGYVFAGWFTDAELKNPIEAITADMTGDITLYAAFAEKTYTVKYVMTGPDWDIQDFEVYSLDPVMRTASEGFVLSVPVSVNVFYVFDGWFADAQFTQPVTEIPKYTASNVTVYAKWSKIVTYVPVWGDVSLSNGLTTADVKLLLRHIAHLEELGEEQQIVGDVNNDGRITTADAKIALRLAAKLDTVESISALYGLGQIVTEDGKITVK